MSVGRCLLVLALAAPVGAQGTAPRALPQLEARLDAVASPAGGATVGVGINRRAGWYARVGATASAGVVRTGAGWAGVQRLEVVSRFLFDPFGEFRRGVYGGGGVALWHQAGATRPTLILLAGVEGPRVGSAVPSVEVALGGGVRVGVAWRRRREVGR